MTDEETEARATRRRWLTLAEVLGVAAVVISGLTLWNNVEQRRGAEADRQAAAAAATRAGGRLAVIANVADGGERLILSDADHRIERLEVTFPPVLKVAPQSSVGEAAIDADWVRAPVLAITDGGADALEGRLPIAVTAMWWDGDTERRDRAVYDLVFATKGRLVGGRSFRLKGLARRGPAGARIGDRLDTLWAAELTRLATVKN